jgi:DNA-binding Xre family transcriptional regulator
MTQSLVLVCELKRTLRERKVTYAQLARQLSRSEASVKRWFAHGRFTLTTIDRICGAAGIELTDLLDRLRNPGPERASLSLAEEEQLVSEPGLFLLTLLLLNRWTYERIVAVYGFDSQQMQGMLIRLDRLGIIDLLPENRWRLRLSPEPGWLPGGPVQKHLTDVVLKEFFAARFNGPGAELRFVTASLTTGSHDAVRRSMQRLVREVSDLAEHDAHLPAGQAASCAMVLAIRPCDYAAVPRHPADAAGRSVGGDWGARERRAEAARAHAPALHADRQRAEQ